MSAVVTVVAPGLLTTVQDLGRWGHQDIGVPVAGAMDPFSHRLANALVGNDRHAATLEVTLAGPTLRFGDPRAVAVAGARFDVTLDGCAVPHGTAVQAAAGGLLSFGERRSGARAYVAVAGGIDVPPLLGSRATHVGSAMGGHAGRPLIAGDRLPLGTPRRPPARRTADANSQGEPLNSAIAPTGAAQATTLQLRVLRGPQDDRFSSDALDTLLAAPYLVSVDSNRMGYRLEGVTLRHRGGADIISDATPLGSIQVPGSGQALLLMADRQTTGGYPKLATVISADIGVAAQAAPGDRLQFVLCSDAEAIRALLARERPLLALESSS